MREINSADWKAEAASKFGADRLDWRFVCPVCKHEASAREWIEAGAHDAIAFSCIGRWQSKARDAFSEAGAGPCNYAGGGLFQLNPVRVIWPDGQVSQVFEFGAAP